MLHLETWFYGTYPLTLHAIKPLNRRKLTLLSGFTTFREFSSDISQNNRLFTN